MIMQQHQASRIARPRNFTAAGLSALMVLVALLVFSPLHTHDANRPGYCSIGHVEKALVSGAEAQLEFDPAPPFAVAEPEFFEPRVAWADAPVIPARGPPA